MSEHDKLQRFEEVQVRQRDGENWSDAWYLNGAGNGYPYAVILVNGEAIAHFKQCRRKLKTIKVMMQDWRLDNGCFYSGEVNIGKFLMGANKIGEPYEKEFEVPA